MKRKITVTTGSRSEYGLLRPVLRKIEESDELKLYLIVAGMHLSKKHGLTINEIKKDGFDIYAKVNMIPKGDSLYHMAKVLGYGISEFSEIFRKLKPNINVILGDRDEAFSSALAACHMNIPNAHIHGGEISQAGIDEYNRHAITKISNIHFAATKKSKEHILRMGEKSKYVFFTGSPGIDDIMNGKIKSKDEIERYFGIELSGKEILLVYHPVTTQIEKNSENILKILKAIVKVKRDTIIIAPNSDAGNKKIFENLYKYSKRFPFIKVYRSIPRSFYLSLLKNCGMLIGNSSSGLIEGGYFDIPVINIGIRQKDRERGNNVLNVDESSTAIYKAILKASKLSTRSFPKKYIYGKGNASQKIVQILETIPLNKDLIQKQLSY